MGLTARAGQEQLSTTHSLAPPGATAGHVCATGDLHKAAWSRPQKAGPADSSGGGCQEALFICPHVQPLKQGFSLWAPRGHFGLHDLGCYRPGMPLNINANSAKVERACFKATILPIWSH